MTFLAVVLALPVFYTSLVATLGFQIFPVSKTQIMFTPHSLASNFSH